MFLVLACISLIIFELSFFMILAFKTRPERWTFKSFCLWLVSYLGLMGRLSAFVRVD